MKRLFSFWVVLLLTIFLGITSSAQARTGDSSSRSSSSKSSRSSSSKNHSSSSSSYSFSKSKKTTSATDSAFSRTAKTNQAKTAWQERNKKTDDTSSSVVVSTPDNSGQLQQELADLRHKLEIETGRKKSKKLEKRLAAIEKQIADAKRQQQLIAIAQTAAQVLMNKSNTANANTKIVPTPTPPVVNNKTDNSNNNEEGSGFILFLLLIGGVVVFFWLRKSNNSATIYRL